MENSQSLSVLVVDDDEANRLMIRAALEAKNFTIIEAGDGREGFELFEQSHPDLILSDVMMPNVNGFELSTKIRGHKAGKHIPILMMTALEDYESINEAYEVGTTDFITKPVNFHLLAFRLRYILRAKETADQLRISQARLMDAQRIAKLGHWELEVETGFIHCSSETNQILGFNQEEPLTNIDDFLRLLTASDRKQFLESFLEAKQSETGFTHEHKLKRKDGSIIHINLFAEHRNDNSGNGVLSGAIQDITQRKRIEQQITHLSWYNKLTGLPNRHLLLRNLRSALSLASRNSRTMAILLLNLDNFERINAGLGYSAGDELLLKVKEKLMGCVRDADTIANCSLEKKYSQLDNNEMLAHLGGDDFVILLSEIASAEDAAIVARRVSEKFKQPIKINGKEISITLSIGISIYPDDGDTEEQLMKNVSAALHDAKDNGRDCYKFYTKEMNARTFERMSLEASLRKAVDNNQFTLFYQPKIYTADNSICGAEALIRWNHPELGLVGPSDFISLAESSGIIIDIGEWVINESCRQLQVWKNAGICLDNLSINISTAHLKDNNLIHSLQSAITKYNIEPSCYDIEVTESVLMDNINSVLPIMDHLRSLGIDLSIDDFGTGYSSLAYLRRLPITALKIDQSFIRDIEPNMQECVIVDAIIALAHSMKLKIIAEGIETEAQADYLRSKRCHILQGYYYSEPIPADEFSAWYHEHKQSGVKTAISA